MTSLFSGRDVARKCAILFLGIMIVAMVAGCDDDDDDSSDDGRGDSEVTYSLSDGVGDWAFVWDEGTSDEEWAYYTFTVSGDTLYRDGVPVDVSVTSSGYISWTDSGGYYHTGQMAPSKDYMGGSYSGHGETGTWSATRVGGSYKLEAERADVDCPGGNG